MQEGRPPHSVDKAGMGSRSTADAGWRTRKRCGHQVVIASLAVTDEHNQMVQSGLMCCVLTAGVRPSK
ncbi:hypothetical protein FHG87_002104 [Trinorchestia longiramus]|nr:hypothetical protein FHG87_002104 [Trinorchestia longiramus]